MQHNKATRLAEVTHVLRDSLRSNSVALRKVAESRSDRVAAFSEVELASWSALQDDAFDLIPSAELKRDLARHFERVALVISMNEQRTQRMAARLNQIRMGEDQATPFESEWLRILKERAAEASEEAGRLADRLEEVGQRAAREGHS
jgi:hypothetical protein